MGMDGLSFSNTSALREKTSAEITNKTEQAIQADPAYTSRQVLDITTNPKVKEKEEDEDQTRKKSKNQQETEDTFNDGLVEESENDYEEVSIEDFENPNKDFYVKLNTRDDIIELYDSTTDKLIETISGSELGELVQKLNLASGIFINKKV